MGMQGELRPGLIAGNEAQTVRRRWPDEVFGLTGLVRDAMGEEMRDIFPFIRPLEAGAYAGY